MTQEHESTRGDRKPDDPPGALSDQNAEEQPGGASGSRPGSDREGAGQSGSQDPRGDEGSGGASGEGSQSTGHPDSAG
jgi:hypothetical protein